MMEYPNSQRLEFVEAVDAAEVAEVVEVVDARKEGYLS